MRSLSIRWKLTLWYASVLGAVLVLFCTAVYLTISYQMMKRIDQGLEEELADVLEEIEQANESSALLNMLDRRFARHEGFDFQITDDRRERFFASERLGDRRLPVFPPPIKPIRPLGSTLELDWGRYRVIRAHVRRPDGPLDVQVVRSLAAYDAELSTLTTVFWSVGVATWLVTLGGGYFLAGRALWPVQKINAAAQQITATRLDQRIPIVNARDELGALSTTLNGMIERLERSFQEMQRFTADAAHELRTPLTVIRAEAEVALRSPRSGEEYTHVLENLLEETNRLGQIADQLLFLCRQDAGLHPEVRQEVPLEQLIQDVVGHMRALAQEKGVSLSLETAAHGALRTDAIQLRRVFYNILDNAIKFTPTQGRVTVGSTLDEGHWSVVVKDTGVGIAPEHLSHVFDRFYRADPARGSGNGAGLGLAICQSVVRGMGGEIEVHSTLGKGTTVTVRLPRDGGVESPVSRDECRKSVARSGQKRGRGPETALGSGS